MKYRLILLSITICFIACKQAVPNTKKGPAVKSEIGLEHLVIEPKVKSAKSPVLFLLHGLGSNEKDLHKFGQNLNDNLYVISVRAPIQRDNGRGYAWYPLTIQNGNKMYKYSAVDKSLIKLKKFIQQCVRQYDLDTEEIFIGGFSQGAIMSLQLLLESPELLSGVVAFSGYILPEALEEFESNNYQNAVPIFISHGSNDKVIGINLAKQTAAFLTERGFDVNTSFDDVQHTISKQHYQDFRNWLQNKLNK